MKLNCWIIDDEPLALDLLQSYIDKTSFLSLRGRFSNASDAMMNLSETKVDLIFLDIQMPEVNGMEFARFIGDDTRIIFTTAFGEYALESYKVNALDYLLKPFSYSDFLVAAKKAFEWFELKKSKTNLKTEKAPAGVFIRSEYKLLQVLFDEILYIEGLKDYIKIYTESGGGKPILTLMSMKAIEDKLPGKEFQRVHRSFIVNISKVRKINKNRIIIGEKEIPIGETYRQNFFDLVTTNN